MQLVRQIQLKQTKLLRDICRNSKDLYNVAVYTVRQHFFSSGEWMRYNSVYTLLKEHEAYRKLFDTCGSHAPQQVLRQVDSNFKGFFQALKSYKIDPNKFKARPRLPNYKQKNGTNIVSFTALQCRLKDEFALLTNKMLDLGFPKLRCDLPNLQGVRIVPNGDRFNIEMIYTVEVNDSCLDRDNAIGIDIGLNNLVTTSDTRGQSAIVKGGVVKSINQFYNKKLSKYKSSTMVCNGEHNTNKILRLTRKRNNKIRDVFHKVSRKIVDQCIERNIGTIVIGYNSGWKQDICIGKRNNQNFVSVPFLKLIQQIEYKAELVGIQVKRVTEEYTSQICSCCGIVDKTNRKHRGLYVCKKCGSVMNADINASRNILYKEVPKSVRIGDRGRLSRPVVLVI